MNLLYTLLEQFVVPSLKKIKQKTAVYTETHVSLRATIWSTINHYALPHACWILFSHFACFYCHAVFRRFPSLRFKKNEKMVSKSFLSRHKVQLTWLWEKSRYFWVLYIDIKVQVKICVCVYVCVCVYIYIYIYIFTSNCVFTNLYLNIVPEGKLCKVIVGFQDGIYPLSWMRIS